MQIYQNIFSGGSLLPGHTVYCTQQSSPSLFLCISPRFLCNFLPFPFFPCSFIYNFFPSSHFHATLPPLLDRSWCKHTRREPPLVVIPIPPRIYIYITQYILYTPAFRPHTDHTDQHIKIGGRPHPAILQREIFFRIGTGSYALLYEIVLTSNAFIKSENLEWKKATRRRGKEPQKSSYCSSQSSPSFKILVSLRKNSF